MVPVVPSAFLFYPLPHLTHSLFGILKQTTYLAMKIWDPTNFSLLWTIIPKHTHHHLASIRTYSRKEKVTEVFPNEHELATDNIVTHTTEEAICSWCKGYFIVKYDRINNNLTRRITRQSLARIAREVHDANVADSSQQVPPGLYFMYRYAKWCTLQRQFTPAYPTFILLLQSYVT